MNKLYLIGGSLLVVSVLLLIAIAVGTNTPQTRDAPINNEPTGFGVFEAPQNVFESLRGSADTPAILNPRNTENSVLSDDEQARRISALIREWETSATDTNFQTRAQPILSVEESVETTRRESDKQEITDIFNSLLGTKVSGIFDGTVDDSGGDFSSAADLWLGDYNDTTRPLTSLSSTPETATQKALHAYGNALGKSIKAFQLAQGDQTALLEKFLEDRNDTRALEALTSAYHAFSEEIAAIQAPGVIADTHAGLVNSYDDIGTYLWRLTKAQNDEELVEKMLSYNTISETVAKRQVNIITLFKAHGVEFKSYEPGSLFSFSPPASRSLGL